MSEPTPQAEPERRYLVVYRESDRLLAEAFDTDVPLVAAAEVPADSA